MSNQKLRVWLPLLFAVVMVIGMFMGYKMRDGIPGKSFFYRERPTSLGEITDLLKDHYVDEVDLKNLTDTAIQAMLARLDPHSIYIPATELQDVNEQIMGSFYGIGIEFSLSNDSLNVVNVLSGGPADKAGLLIGDIIISAGDSIISGKKMERERIRNILRGPLGSTVKLGYVRDNKTQQTELRRGEIPLSSIDAAYMIEGNIGYIRLNKFSTQTYKEFMTSLMALKKQGLQSLVLDLRGNGGGVLDEAIEIADEFLAGDKLITYTEGLHTTKKEYRCRRNGQFEEGELVLLSDEGTASASEVLLGALQDWDRGTIVGRRSFGKGLVGEQFNLSNGAALRLTVARYFTPMGRSIQRSYKNGAKSYYADISNRYTDGEMVSIDSVKNDTTKVYKTRSGKRLFGGGGISPDDFIAADTSNLSPVMAKLYSRGTLSDFGYKYYRLYRGQLLQYKTPQQFVRDFALTENDQRYFNSLAAEDSLDLSKISVKEKNFISANLKSVIAQQLFRTEGYFEAINADDNFIRKALEILKK